MKPVCPNDPQCNLPEEFTKFRINYEAKIDRDDEERHKVREAMDNRLKDIQYSVDRLSLTLHGTDTIENPGVVGILYKHSRTMDRLEEKIIPEFGEVIKSWREIKEDIHYLKKETMLTRFCHRVMYEYKGYILAGFFLTVIYMISYGQGFKDALKSVLRKLLE